jgi:hypothetical protein
MFPTGQLEGASEYYPPYTFREQEIAHKMTKVVGDSEIFIGFHHNLSLNEILNASAYTLRREIVTLQLPPTGELFNCIVTGQAGSGKSQSFGFQMVVDQMIRRFGDRFNTLMVDPSGEYGVCNQIVSPDSTPAQIWEKLGIQPENDIFVKTYQPYACASADAKEGTYKIEFEKISLDDLMTLLNIKSGREDDDRQVDILTEAVYRWYSNRGVDEPQPDPLCPPFDELIETIKDSKLGGKVLLRLIFNLKNQGFVGNDVEFPSPPMAQNLYNRDGTVSVQCLHTTTDEFISHRMAGIVQVEVKKLIAEQTKRYKLNLSGVQTSFMPLLLFMDEYQRVYKTNFYKNIFDTCGKFLIYQVGICPSLADLPDRTPIRQANYLICSRIAPSEEKGVKEILGKLVDPTILSELYDPGKGMFPKQFALIKKERGSYEDDSGNILAFYPAQTITRILKRRSIRVSRPRIEEQAPLSEFIPADPKKRTIEVMEPEVGDLEAGIDGDGMEYIEGDEGGDNDPLETDDGIPRAVEVNESVKSIKPTKLPAGTYPKGMPIITKVAPVEKPKPKFEQLTKSQKERFLILKETILSLAPNDPIDFAEVGKVMKCTRSSIAGTLDILRIKGYVDKGTNRGSWILLKDENGDPFKPPQDNLVAIT